MISYYFSHITFYVEWVAFLTSINCFSFAYPRPMRLFSLVLGVIVVLEICAVYMAFRFHHNGIVYNILDFIWYPGYMFIFYQLVQNIKHKKYIRVILILFYVSITINFIFFEDHKWLSYRVFIIGGLGVVVCSILALIQIGTFKNQYSFKNDPLFWVSLAMLSYFFPTSIVLGGFEYFGQKEIPISDAYGQAFLLSQKILNVIHYSLLSYAFVCRSIFPQTAIDLENKSLKI